MKITSQEKTHHDELHEGVWTHSGKLYIFAQISARTYQIIGLSNYGSGFNRLSDTVYTKEELLSLVNRDGYRPFIGTITINTEQ